MSMPPPPPPHHYHHSTAVSDNMMELTEQHQRPVAFTVSPPTTMTTAPHDPSSSSSSPIHNSTNSSSTNANINNNISGGLTITNTPIATTNHPHHPHKLDTAATAATTTTTTTTTTNTSNTTTAVSSSFWTNVHQSLDEAVNEFLMIRGSDTDGAKHPPGHHHNNKNPQLPQNDLERLPFLIQQRSYMDALLTTRLLLEGSSSHYTTLFDALKNLYPHNSSSSSNNNHQNHHHPTSNNNNATATTIELALDTHKQDLVTIMTIHIISLMKLQLWTELTAELEAWTFCFHHRALHESVASSSSSLHDTTTLSSWIPWDFHILAASTLPDRHSFSTTCSVSGDGTPLSSPLDRCDALDRIRHAIIARSAKDTNNNNNDTTVINNTATLLLKVENTLHNAYLHRKDYRMALQCIDRMIELIPMAVTEDLSQLPLLDHNDERLRRILSATYQSEYWSRQGRILLQLGVLDAADVIFDQTKDLVRRQSRDDETDAPAVVMMLLRRVMNAQVASNDGLMKFSRGKFEEALESFHTVNQELRSIRHNHSSETPAPLRLLESIRSNLYCETTNNMALCALYTCRLHEGIQLLESLIRDDVRAHLNERVTLNLCTMYELAMDASAAMRKKKILQCLATRFVIQDIPAECFRIG